MRKGEQTRQRIIETAAPLFNQRGFEGCSMADIMEATSLGKGGIYRYFETKEELAAEVLAFSLLQSRKMRTDDLPDTPSALEKLRAAIHRFVNVPSPIRGGCPLLNAAVDTDDGNAKLRLLVTKALADWRLRLAAMVRQAIDNGELRPETDAETVVDTIIAALEGAQVLSRLDGTRAPLERVQATLDYLLQAMATPSSGSR